MAKAKVRKIELLLHCDFCRATEHDTALLIAAPRGDTHICGECVVICAEMVRDEASSDDAVDPVGEKVTGGPRA